MPCFSAAAAHSAVDLCTCLHMQHTPVTHISTHFLHLLAHSSASHHKWQPQDAWAGMKGGMCCQNIYNHFTKSVTLTTCRVQHATADEELCLITPRFCMRQAFADGEPCDHAHVLCMTCNDAWGTMCLTITPFVRQSFAHGSITIHCV